MRIIGIETGFQSVFKRYVLHYELENVDGCIFELQGLYLAVKKCRAIAEYSLHSLVIGYHMIK